MKFRLYREYGALNSAPIFDAVERGLKSLGHEIVTVNEDIAVIWSVLWSGRMKANQSIYNNCRRHNKPIMIIEVGNLKRNRSWRLSLENINGLGIFNNDTDLDPSRPQKLSVALQPLKHTRKPEILIAAQHERSQQWIGMPSMGAWVEKTISVLKSITDRKIIVRPHPRSPFALNIANVVLDRPRAMPNSYDDFNIDYNYHCVINYNSGPAVQAAINGVPIICDSSSLAAPLSNKIENIETVSLPDRELWFLQLCHTEWTVEEIAQGIPIERLLRKIS